MGHGRNSPHYLFYFTVSYKVTVAFLRLYVWNYMRVHYLICYDISNNQRRKALAQWLEGHGERLQYSVFLVGLPVHQEQYFFTELQSFIDISGDSVMAIALCAKCLPASLSKRHKQTDAAPHELYLKGYSVL